MSSIRIQGRWIVPLFTGLLTALLSCACSVKQASSESHADCFGNVCDAGSEESDDSPPTAIVPFDAAAAETPLPDAATPEICPGLCIPDNAQACSGYQPPPIEVTSSNQFSATPSGEQSAVDMEAPLVSGSGEQVMLLADAGVSLDLGTDQGVDAGRDQDDSGGAGAEPPTTEGAGAEQDASVRDAGIEPRDAGAAPIDTVVIEAGEALPEPEPVEVTYSCQLQPDGPALLASCAPAGSGVVGDACSSGADCAAGFACVVGRLGTGQCQPYCCAGRGSCDAGLICTERQLMGAEHPEGSNFKVPVCAFPDQCDLMDPFPCPSGQGCSCSPGLACSVVGRDGAKACMDPGNGLEGDACPCAAGFFCSPAQQQCMKLCQFGSGTCGDGTCQGVGGFPDGWGLCVGSSDPRLQDGP